MVQCLGFCIFLFRVYKGVFNFFFSRQKEEEEEEEDLFGVISQSAFLVEPFDVLLLKDFDARRNNARERRERGRTPKPPVVSRSVFFCVRVRGPSSV